MVKVANHTKNLFKSLLMSDNYYAPHVCIHLIGGHASPFPFLVVMAMDNKVAVVHGIQYLTFPFEANHPQEGEPVTFIQDTVKEKTPPRIFKLDKRDFEDAEEWFHPSINEVMNMHPMEQEVIPVKDTSKTIRTSKIIPIPVFLVPLLMNEGQPQNPM